MKSSNRRLYAIITLSIAVIFLIIGIVQGQMELFTQIESFTEDQVRDFLEGYVVGFPKPWQ